MKKNEAPSQGMDSAEFSLPLTGKRMPGLYIAAICIFAAVVPLVLATGLWLWMSIAEGRHEIDNYMSMRALQVSQDVDAWISEEYEVLAAVGSALRIEQDNLDSFQKTMVAMDEKVSRWKVMTLYDAETGQVLRDTLGNRELQPKNRILSSIRQVAETGKPTLCTCFVQEKADNPEHGIHAFVPIFENGVVRYVLSVVLRYDIIQRIVETAAAPFYDVGIIDEKDFLIARTHRDESFRGQLPSEGFRLNARGLTQPEGKFSARTYSGSISSAAYSRSALTGWTVISGTSADNVDALALQTKWAFFGISGLFLVLMAVLAIMILYNMMLRRISAERLAASTALQDLQGRLLSTTSDALEEQSKAASEREVLLREIYHRVKNNLQIIQSLMRLGARNLSPEQQGPFDAAVRRIGAMARVHTLLYNSPDLASIDLRDYLSSLVAEISESFGAGARNIQTRLNLQSMEVPLDYAIPLAFISVELLANAFKHAFPEGSGEGTVSITARQEGDQGILIIGDSGVGMPVTEGRRKSLGLNLVDRLVEQINGTLEKPVAGQSEYRITFPLSEPKA